MYSYLEECRGVYTVFSLSWREPLDFCYVLMLPGTWANNVDKCSFILERTLIQMFIHTRENPYTNVSTP